MVRLALTRLVWLPLVLLAVSFLVYATLLLVPGDPAVAILGPYATPERIAELHTQLGLDRSLPVQYASWIGGVVQGDFGWSYSLDRPVSAELADRAGPTFLLAGIALLVATLFGLMFGTLAALRQNEATDRLVTLGLMLGLSVPPFLSGLLFILFFAVWWRVLPAGGLEPVWGPSGPLEILRHLILPATTLALVATAIIGRLMRTQVLEILRLDFVRAARAKGLGERRILLSHVLRNAFPPMVPVIALQAGFLLSGAVYVETVFQWPGLGRMLVDAIKARDLMLVQGGVLIIAASYVAINLAADLLQASLDRRGARE